MGNNYNCERCDQEFVTRGALYDHKDKICTGARNMPCKCSHCGSMFQTVKGLNSHQDGYCPKMISQYAHDALMKEFEKPPVENIFKAALAQEEPIQVLKKEDWTLTIWKSVAEFYIEECARLMVDLENEKE